MCRQKQKETEELKTVKFKEVNKRDLHKKKTVYITTFLGVREVKSITEDRWVVDDTDRYWDCHAGTNLFMED